VTHEDWHDLTAIDAGVSATLEYINIMLQLQLFEHVAQSAEKTTAGCTIPGTTQTTGHHHY